MQAIMAHKVLVVDDDPLARRVLQHYLERAGYQMLTARNGHEAIEVATRELPPLIIMDVMMPDLDGLEALRRLKTLAATSEIPVIVLTSSGLRLTELEAAASGAAIFLTKPFTESDLLSAVRRLVPETTGADSPGKAQT
jgi:CheY-like chemotaxis protein